MFYPLGGKHHLASPCESLEPDGEIQAQGPNGNSLGVVYAKGCELNFRNFPGKLFDTDSMPVALPDSGFTPWRNRNFISQSAIRAFHFAKPGKGTPNEWIYAVDRMRNLVCWYRQQVAGNTITSFNVVERSWPVLGAQQDGGILRYAMGTPTGAPTSIVELDVVSGERKAIDIVEVDGLQAIFAGDVCAVEASHGTAWHVRYKGSTTITEIDPLASVIGCAPMPSASAPGMIFLPDDRASIEFRAGAVSQTLIELDEPAASATYDPMSRRVAWIGKTSGNVTVQCIDDSQPLLTVSGEGRAA